MKIEAIPAPTCRDCFYFLLAQGLRATIHSVTFEPSVTISSPDS